jgi:hypothetical protein
MFQPTPLFVGLRYSLAREHSFFVSFITWVSLLGVAVGVWALIVVLSVMNGFETELRTRLLSVSAHAVLTAVDGEPLRDWRQTLQELHGAQGLVGAAPYLDTDAMLSRGRDMSGAIVRGIDPALEPEVSAIGDSMREGKLADLTPGSNRIVLGLTLAYELQVGVSSRSPESSRSGFRITMACSRSSICRMPKRCADSPGPRGSASNSTTYSRRPSSRAPPPRAFRAPRRACAYATGHRRTRLTSTRSGSRRA